MMKAYTSYKKSGIEWVGEIPSHWDIVKIKYISPVKRGASPRPIADEKYFDEKGIYSWVRIADVSSSERYLLKTTETLSELGASLSVKRYPGDLFVSIAGSVGKVIITKIKCCIHDGFVWFPELKINPEFFYYIFESKLPYKGLGKVGTQLNLNIETIGNIFIPKVSDLEMELIVKYLDYQTNIIDQLIEKKEKLVELLQEQRQAIINEAVTCGIDDQGNIRRKPDCLPAEGWKDSGIEWLGVIPEEWELIPLRFLTQKVGSGVTPRGGADVYVEEGVIFIRSQNVHFDGLRLDDVSRINPETHDKMSNSKVYKGDVLLNITGASIGRACAVDSSIEMNVNQHVCILRSNDKINYKYLNLLLQSQVGQSQISLGTTGGNREGLNFEAIKDFTFPIPSKKIQNSLISNINLSINKFDRLIGKIESQIQKLKEYRQSIISEAVTGKIDLRVWEAPKKETA